MAQLVSTVEGLAADIGYIGRTVSMVDDRISNPLSDTIHPDAVDDLERGLEMLQTIAGRSDDRELMSVAARLEAPTEYIVRELRGRDNPAAVVRLRRQLNRAAKRATRTDEMSGAVNDPDESEPDN